ncbi:hypothetical protein N9L68_09360 [bacterium]|nr:hypothetical protein [bacterium]
MPCTRPLARAAAGVSDDLGPGRIPRARARTRTASGQDSGYGL